MTSNLGYFFYVFKVTLPHLFVLNFTKIWACIVFSKKMSDFLK